MSEQITTTITKREIIKRMGEAGYQRNWELFKTFLSNDILFKVGGLPEKKGPDAVADLYIQTFKTDLVLEGLKTRGSWELEDIVIIEYDTKATRVQDNKQVEFPCVDTYRFKGNKIHEWRVYPMYPLFIGKFS